MSHFRMMGKPMLKPLGAINPQKTKCKGSNYRNPLRPLPIEFHCDVVLAIQAVLHHKVTMARFEAAYVWYDAEGEIEQNVHAFKVLGGRCHSVEQRVGAEFLRRGIYPLEKYLNPPRPGYKNLGVK